MNSLPDEITIPKPGAEGCNVSTRQAKSKKISGSRTVWATQSEQASKQTSLIATVTGLVTETEHHGAKARVSQQPTLCNEVFSTGVSSGEGTSSTDIPSRACRV